MDSQTDRSHVVNEKTQSRTYYFKALGKGKKTEVDDEGQKEDLRSYRSRSIIKAYLDDLKER